MASVAEDACLRVSPDTAEEDGDAEEDDEVELELDGRETGWVDDEASLVLVVGNSTSISPWVVGYSASDWGREEGAKGSSVKPVVLRPARFRGGGLRREERTESEAGSSAERDAFSEVILGISVGRERKGEEGN
jgi:hypothetical protein